MWSAHPLDGVLVAVDVEMRRRDEEVDAVELDAVDLGIGGEAQERIERDDRLAVAALADDARPGGIVELRIGIRHRILPDRALLRAACSARSFFVRRVLRPVGMAAVRLSLPRAGPAGKCKGATNSRTQVRRRQQRCRRGVSGAGRSRAPRRPPRPRHSPSLRCTARGWRAHARPRCRH